MWLWRCAPSPVAGTMGMRLLCTMLALLWALLCTP